MKEENLGNLLNELAERTTERVRPGLAEDIKRQIPHSLTAHKGRVHTISIIIDLRISKLTAAAAIIITMILLANLFSGRAPTDSSIYQESKVLMKYLFRRGNYASAVRSRYQHLVQQGSDITYYGNNIASNDSNAVLMQWKVSDGKYKVVFGDLSEREVSAEELIKLQAQMLQKKTK